MRKQSLHLSAYPCDSCAGPVVAGWLAVREHYQAKHGAGFNLKQFHESALREGEVPLPVLDTLLQ